MIVGNDDIHQNYRNFGVKGRKALICGWRNRLATIGTTSSARRMMPRNVVLISPAIPRLENVRSSSNLDSKLRIL